jgi:GGDEF domain-containing protein
MAVSATPLFDKQGVIIGARGIDITELDGQNTQIAGELRRAEAIRHILACVGEEAGTEAMMKAALWALILALGAEGGAVFRNGPEGGPINVLHQRGARGIGDSPDGCRTGGAGGVRQMSCPEPRRTLRADNALPNTFRSQCRFGHLAQQQRAAVGRRRHLAVGIGGQSRWHDPRLRSRRTGNGPSGEHRFVTGLSNRRAFMDEVCRHVARLDRDNDTPTLTFVDLDAFKAVNDRLGHAEGDKVLVCLAELLRKLVPPGDLIGCLGGDEFAIWLNDADHTTAAERADTFARQRRRRCRRPFRKLFRTLAFRSGSRPDGRKATRRSRN